MARKKIVKAATIGVKYPMQGLYLSKVNTYVNNPTERAKKVKYCVQEKFNMVLMYGIDGIINSQSYWAGLRAFIRELRGAGVKYVVMAYSNDSVKTFLNAFQDASLPTENFDKIISEVEPWITTSGVSWAEYQRRISSMQTWAVSEADIVDTLTYQGWIQKPTGTDMTVNAINTINNVNKVCLHHYNYPLPNPSYGIDRWKEYALRASRLGYSATNKKVVMPIYSAELEFSQTGFKTKAPVTCYDEQVAWLDTQTFAGKECLDYKKGFLVFKDTDLMVARPLK